jgi:hypothetical protein
MAEPAQKVGENAVRWSFFALICREHLVRRVKYVKLRGLFFHSRLYPKYHDPIRSDFDPSSFYARTRGGHHHGVAVGLGDTGAYGDDADAARRGI